jgi:hypothetical protein
MKKLIVVLVLFAAVSCQKEKAPLSCDTRDMLITEQENIIAAKRRILDEGGMNNIQFTQWLVYCMDSIDSIERTYTDCE